jgi:NAD(P)-dependent dehydrogenase (short-subunit alcohol dehydrogenase family)
MTTEMKGKVVVITGATSGIGQVAAETLAGMGARIVQVARDHERGQLAMKRLAERAPGITHSIYYADLSLLSEMQRVASEIVAAESHIDVLMNNAGAMFGTRQLTADGLERTFALNYMSYFVLTHGLRARLLGSAPARVVNTASNAHLTARLDIDDLQSARAHRGGLESRVPYWGGGFQLYARSKLCDILFTRELARRLAGTGVTANCDHPGFVATRFGDESGGLLALGTAVAKHFAITAEQGARTMIYLASSPDVAQVTGEYFYRCRPIAPSRAGRDDAMAERLWAESERLLTPRT